MANDEFDKLPQEENNEAAELSSLISNAIENKRILDTDHKPGINTMSMQAQRGNISKTGSIPVPTRTGSIPVPTRTGSIPVPTRTGSIPKVSRTASIPKVNPDNYPASKKDTSSVKTTKKKKWSKKKKVTVGIEIAFLVLCLLVVLAIWYLKSKTDLFKVADTTPNYNSAPVSSSDLVDGPDTLTQEQLDAKYKELQNHATKISDENVMNILLVGEDLRDTTDNVAGEEDPRGNTDVMLLISINTEKKKIVMTSLMRDMYIYLGDDYGYGRLNAAYWHGGLPLLENTTEDYFNIAIDRYVMVNFKAFMNIIDTVGGVTADVSEEELAALTAPMAEQNKILGFKKGTDYLTSTGTQLLNGNQALGYARIRKGCGDDQARTGRQREIMTQIIKQAKKLNLVQLDKLITEVAKETTTDITDGEIASLLIDAFDFMNYDICQVQMPADGYYTGETINSMAVLVPDYQINSALLQDIIFGDSKNIDEAIKKYEDGEFDSQIEANNNNNYADNGNNNYNGYGQYSNGYYDDYGNWYYY